MNNRIDEIVIAKAIAIFGVLLVHCTGNALGEVSTTDESFMTYNFLSTLGRWGTPTFMMLGAFVLFYVYSKKEVNFKLFKNFYVKRLKYIVVPYIVISTFYFLIRWNITGISALENSEKWNRYFGDLLNGTANAHLYFVVISIQFYLIFPFLMILMKKVKWFRWLAVPIGVLAQVIWIYLNKEYFQVQNKGSVVFSYSVFYMLGAFIGVYYDWFKEKIREIKAVKYVFYVCLTVGFISGLVGYGLYNYLARIGQWSVIEDTIPFLDLNVGFEIFWAGYAVFASIMILVVANKINVMNPIIKGVMMKIGAVSFGIYLIHPYYLIQFREWWAISYEPGSAYHLNQVLIFVLVSLASYVTVVLIQKLVPYNWVIFGKVENVKKTKKENGICFFKKLITKVK